MRDCCRLIICHVFFPRSIVTLTTGDLSGSFCASINIPFGIDPSELTLRMKIQTINNCGFVAHHDHMNNGMALRKFNSTPNTSHKRAVNQHQIILHWRTFSRGMYHLILSRRIDKIIWTTFRFVFTMFCFFFQWTRWLV